MKMFVFSTRFPLVISAEIQYTKFRTSLSKECHTMAKQENKVKSIEEMYSGIHMVNGCAMDSASYERHVQAQKTPAAVPAPVVQPTAPQPVQPYDPFEQHQDFRAIAARAFDEDRSAVQPQTTAAPAVEYRPGAVQYVTHQVVAEPQTEVIGETVMTLMGSGSYRTSGSYLLTSGSGRTLYEYEYQVSSGSYLTSSGSYLTSGSNPLASGSVSAFPEAPYYTSDMHLLGGYGIDLI